MEATQEGAQHSNLRITQRQVLLRFWGMIPDVQEDSRIATLIRQG